MNIGYFNIHCNSIGDTIANAELYFAVNQYANQKNLKIIAILHIILFDDSNLLTDIKNVNPLFSMHTPFLNLQKKAKLIDDFTFIFGIDCVNINTAENDIIVKDVIKRYFASKDTKIERILDSEEFYNILNNIKQEDIQKFYIDKFNFLKKDTLDSYGIIQYCSFHYNNNHLDEYNKCYKRISLENIINWIDETKLKTYKFIGSEYDENNTTYIINKLKYIYTDVHFINLCGMTSIEESFQEIYNSTNVLSTESFVGLLGGIFNIPSKLYFRYNNLDIMSNFKNHMKLFNKLTIEPDKKLTEND